MTIEQLAYKLEPAGHEEQKPKRKFKPADKTLQRKFERWLKTFPNDIPCLPDDVDDFLQEQYFIVKKIVNETKPTASTAQALVLQCQDYDRIHVAGLFLSAVYNNSAEKNIVHNIKIDDTLRWLGYRLKKGKRLLNYAEICDEFGYQSEAPVINYGKAQDLGTISSSLFINMGHVYHILPNDGVHGTSSQVTINFGTISRVTDHTGTMMAVRDPKETVDDSGCVLYLSAKDCRTVPELREYLNNMKQKLKQGKKDPQKAFDLLDELGPEPARKVEQDVQDILRRYRHV